MIILTNRFDYNWTWERIPQYFWYEDTVSINAPVGGEILKIENSNITLTGEDGNTYNFSIPANQQTVAENDLVFEGDELGQKMTKGFGPLITGLLVTLKLSFASGILGLILGLASGLSKTSKNPFFRWPSIFYIEVIRGTPLLVQLFIIYFMFGSVVGLNDRFLCGVIALGLFSGAYAGEIIRSGIQNIHYGQMEAARSLGMSYFQAMVFIILPQVLKNTLPSLAGVFISLIKDSSLVSVMALTDLTKTAREIVSSSFMVFEVWLTIALLYFLLTYGLSHLIKSFENKMRRGER